MGEICDTPYMKNTKFCLLNFLCRPRRMRDDNIKMILREMCCEVRREVFTGVKTQV